MLLLCMVGAIVCGCANDGRRPVCDSTEACAVKRDNCFNRCDTLYKQAPPASCTECCHSLFKSCDNCEPHDVNNCN